MQEWIKEVYHTSVLYDGEPALLGRLIEQRLQNVGRKFVSEKADISRWKARKAIRAIRESNDTPGDGEEIESESADIPAEETETWIEKKVAKQESKDSQSISSQWAYAYDPEEHDEPDVPGQVPVNTVEDVRARYDVGDTWVATRQKTKSWTTTMKVGEGEGKEHPLTVQNFAINVTFERSERRENLRSFVNALKDEVTSEELPSIQTYDYDREASPYCAMLDLADPHIGRYAWAQQTGRSYDLKRAESIYRLAVDRMLDKLASSRELSHVYVPVGHDGAHIEAGGPPQTTTAGTPQDADGKWQEISRVARRCYKYAIESSAEIAPVRAVVIIANHSEHDSWYAGEILRERYKNADHISIVQDNKPTLEKTDRFGNCGFMWFHGKDQKLKDLPMFFANEYSKLWGQTKWREIITGHKHKRTKHTVGDFYEKDGAITRISPSLAAPDAWHYRKGYVSAVRGSQCLTWHRELGYDGDIPFNLIDEEHAEELVSQSV